MNFFSDSSEWRTLFRNAIDWDTLLPLYYPKFPTAEGFKNKEEILQFFEELLTTTGKWTSETVAGRARELDKLGGGNLVNGRVEFTEPLQKTFKEAKEMSLFGLAVDPKWGGMGVPVTIPFFGFEQISRACISTATQVGFFTSIADMIERFCDSDVQDEFLPRIIRGEISGSMCMTEPHAGSDVGAIRTSATLKEDGSYLLNGSKVFITNGGGGLGFVLARVKGAPEGLEGISMFLAEEVIDSPEGKKQNYRVTKIEEKMGMHGSTTCEVVYENSIARLVGKENTGFKMMLHLMNEARLSVGLQSLAGIEASLTMAREYAETRKQFGKPLTELPLMKRNLEDWETEQDGMRAFLVDCISNYDIYQKLHLKKQHTGDLNDKETVLFEHASATLRHRIPLVKYYPSEAFVTLSQKALQVFGGYGFMQEYDIERLHRDSFGAIIYEGTSQIQALMAMKDFMKRVIKNPAKFVQSVVVSHPLGALMSEAGVRKHYQSIQYEFRKNSVGLIMRCFKPEVSLSEKGFKDTLTQVNKVFKKDYWQETGRFDKLMIHAETLCQALSYIEVLKVLSKHASQDPSREGLYYRYATLVTPRLTGLYADWKARN